MRVRSIVTGKVYDNEQVIWISNIAQAAYYYTNHAVIYDINVQNDRLAIAFAKNETHELYKDWTARLVTLCQENEQKKQK